MDRHKRVIGRRVCATGRAPTPASPLGGSTRACMRRISRVGRASTRTATGTGTKASGRRDSGTDRDSTCGWTNRKNMKVTGRRELKVELDLLPMKMEMFSRITTDKEKEHLS